MKLSTRTLLNKRKDEDRDLIIDEINKVKEWKREFLEIWELRKVEREREFLEI
jgi:hypothetical protein